MSNIMLAAPIRIPSPPLPMLIPPPSRSGTPRPARPMPDVPVGADEDDMEEFSTPQMRPRSDTMSSGSSSSTYLQTPETPSILGVLSQGIVSPGETKVRGRQSSYGFSMALEFESPSSTSTSTSIPVSPGHRESIAGVFIMDDHPLPAALTAPLLSPGPAEPASIESYDIEPESRLAWSPLSPPSLPSPTPDEPLSPDAVPSQTLRSRVRRRLERSKSSLRSLAYRDEVSTDEESSSPLPNKKGRLRSFIAKLPRSNSAASLLSLSSNTSGSASAPIDGPSLSIAPPPPSPGVLVRDYAAARTDYFSPIQRQSLMADELAGPVIMKTKNKFKSHGGEAQSQSKGKGKGRTMSPTRRLIQRPSLLSMPSTLPISMVPLSPKSTVPDLEAAPSKNKGDLFGSMLPRELKIQIFKTLAETWRESGRFEGRAGGQKELIRLSRVSREWRDLVLDGQLWPLLHLAPFASSMHPSTLQRIITSARSCITSLSLRGMDSLAGNDLISSFLQYDLTDDLLASSFIPRLPSLTHLDLRGCKSIASHHIIGIILQSPRLQVVNLKGVQGVSSEVIRTIARYSCLTHLDVSRCWDLTLGDLTIFVAMLSDLQASSLRSLRIAGIKSYGHNAAELFPLIARRLVNLEVLDLLGCTHIFTVDIQRFAAVLEEEGRTSSIRHLILSGCASLTVDALGSLVKRMPEMENLELASIPELFRDADSRSMDLEKLVKSMPKLCRLDLEGTGAHGGVTDRLLDALTPGKYAEDGVVGRHLRELRIGYAKNVTSEAIIRLIRGCPRLKVLEVDNTAANNAVMREFLRRRGDPTATLSLIDCRAITPASYGSTAAATRARRGWTGYASLPFMYDLSDALPGSEIAGGGQGTGTSGELAAKPVLKTFWSWRRVGVPPGWREALAAGTAAAAATAANEATAEGSSRRPSNLRRGSSWWRGGGGGGGGDDDDRAGCVIM